MLAKSFVSALSRESIGLRDFSVNGRISREAVVFLDNLDKLRILKLFSTERER